MQKQSFLLPIMGLYTGVFSLSPLTQAPINLLSLCLSEESRNTSPFLQYMSLFDFSQSFSGGQNKS